MDQEEIPFEEYPEFRRSNPDPFVQLAFRIMDRSREERLRGDEDQKLEELIKEEGIRDMIIQEKKRRALNEKWGVPIRITKNLKDLRETRAIKAMAAFGDSSPEGWCFILSSSKGTGKSTAAAHWLMGHISEIHCDTNITQLRRWWSGTRLARVSSYGTEFEKICSLPVMVIDDLGVEYQDKNGNFQQKLDELMDERYSNFRKTVITTNLNADHFKERYGERVADRIREGFGHGGEFYENSEASMRARS